ncbi:MAG: hypothetical protein HRU72_15380 [Planctomycetia bacterium]|nr:MAG: hypothetical protein HRU72_15380 [Planctomycetia bacterium]HQU32303.1 hypothetical protein [Candidatus Brocadia sapporoensis]
MPEHSPGDLQRDIFVTNTYPLPSPGMSRWLTDRMGFRRELSRTISAASFKQLHYVRFPRLSDKTSARTLTAQGDPSIIAPGFVFCLSVRQGLQFS